jgi:aldose 1-epimerase
LTHVLLLNASKYTPVDAGLIPTGELRAVAGTPFDFRKATAIGAHVRDGRDQQIRYGRGYDHNFVLDGTAGALRLAARVADPSSGRVMEIFTKAPGLQFYSGNFLDATFAGKGGRVYREGDALVLEPQLFPDAPNQKGFPSARLDPGNTYVNTMEYRFSTDKPARPPEVK